MLRTVEAVTDENGQVKLLEDMELPRNGRVLITILEDRATGEAALLSQDALIQDWSNGEEDAAWAHLQQER